MSRSLLESLKARELVHDVSHFDELNALLSKESISFYCGFDPTADSLHVGSLLPLTIMRRLQRAGHKPYALVGNATGMIGDPSGKSQERKLISQETLEKNVIGLEKQIGRFLDSDGPSGFTLVKNHDWLGELSLVNFLRDVGKYVSVNSMLAKESVKARLEQREQGISYTEFSYMLLQAYDFYYLNKRYGISLQIGGSDQWGNIVAGIDLIRRFASNPNDQGQDACRAFGLTCPLLTTAQGKKFGKTESGNIWLDPERTSPFRFHQFWLNAGDEDAIRFLAIFTDIELSQISELKEVTLAQPEKREAQKRLADEITALVHGQREVELAKQAAHVLFGGSLEGLSSATLMDIFCEVPSSQMSIARLEQGISAAELAEFAGLASSKSQARKLIEQGGFYINGERPGRFDEVIKIENCIDGELLVMRAGKKNYHLISVDK